MVILEHFQIKNLKDNSLEEDICIKEVLLRNKELQNNKKVTVKWENNN